MKRAPNVMASGATNLIPEIKFNIFIWWKAFGSTHTRPRRCIIDNGCKPDPVGSHNGAYILYVIQMASYM